MRHLDKWLGLIAALLVANLATTVALYRQTARLQQLLAAREPSAALAPASPEPLPRVVHRESPEYPPQAKERGWEGQVIVQITVDTLGRVREARVVRSSGHAVLDSAAVAAARRWRFEPARLKGKPVESTLMLPFRFSLARE